MSDMSSKEIMDIVKEIQSHPLPLPDKAKFFRHRYPEFAEKYSSLFEMACYPNFDFAKLEYMLAMRESVLNGQQSTDDASKKVGQDMFNIRYTYQR
jgi:hypothetical protein